MNKTNPKKTNNKGSKRTQGKPLIVSFSDAEASHQRLPTSQKRPNELIRFGVSQIPRSIGQLVPDQMRVTLKVMFVSAPALPLDQSGVMTPVVHSINRISNINGTSTPDPAGLDFWFNFYTRAWVLNADVSLTVQPTDSIVHHSTFAMGPSQDAITDTGVYPSDYVGTKGWVVGNQGGMYNKALTMSRHVNLPALVGKNTSEYLAMEDYSSSATVAPNNLIYWTVVGAGVFAGLSVNTVNQKLKYSLDVVFGERTAPTS